MALSIFILPPPGLTLDLLMHLMYFVAVHAHGKAEQSLIADAAYADVRVERIKSMEAG